MAGKRMLAKSSIPYEQKVVGNWAIIGFFILALSSFILLKQYLVSSPILNSRLSTSIDLTKLVIEDTNSNRTLNQSSSQPSVSSAEVFLKQEREQICNVSDPKFDYCDLEGDIRIHGISSTIFAASSQRGPLEGNKSWFIKPYPRKMDQSAMRSVKGFSVKEIVGQEEAPSCTVNHSVPAVVFSTGGYAGNYFHSLTDIIIPLFAASAQFHGEVQFLVTNFGKYWINKFQAVVKQLSRYETIDIDTDDNVHCFSHTIVGLKYYKDMRIDPLTASNGYSMKKFRQLLWNAFSLKKSTAIKIGPHTKEKPRLLIISRKRSRAFLNADEITEMAKSLGFEVVVDEAMTNLHNFSHVVNSCDVMLGVHGAGLTNLVFLPTNAILIQVVPWGGLEGIASSCFGQPAPDMDIRYIEYKIREEESSLLQEHPLDHPVFRDPRSVHMDNWGILRSVYLDKQNVRINVGRFKATLLEALELLH